jgi:hypothetical protein
MNKANSILKHENKKWPKKLKQLYQSEWPKNAPENVIEVWRSRKFLVQVYIEKNANSSAIRLSVCRTAIKADGRWQDNISWDELQELKSQCGHGDKAAIEIYPPDKDVVDVANMRHLWLLSTPPPFMWENK